jgi:hypothetical protein
VRAKESERLQGPRLWTLGYILGNFPPGMLHPNDCGQEEIADRLYRCFSRKGDADSSSRSTSIPQARPCR